MTNVNTVALACNIQCTGVVCPLSRLNAFEHRCGIKPAINSFG